MLKKILIIIISVSIFGILIFSIVRKAKRIKNMIINAKTSPKNWIFKNLGVETKLGLFEDTTSNTIKLIFVVDGRPFEVAPECNGFGVMGSAVLLASLLAVARGSRVITACLTVAGALLLGYLANTLRIVIILILAPLVGEHYFVMHEIVGTVTFLGTLFLIWRLWAPKRKIPLEPK